MGSSFSLSSGDRHKLVEKLHGSKLGPFSEFCRGLSQDFIPNRSDLSWSPVQQQHPDPDELETALRLWCVQSCTLWGEMTSGRRRARIARDLLDTLYCTCRAFDNLFVLLFASAKSRRVLGLAGIKAPGRPVAYETVVGEVFRYSSSANLQYHSGDRGSTTAERVVDFPLKTFGLCPCTRRPLYVAAYLGRPDIVRLLLRSGAGVPGGDVCDCVRGSGRHPLENVLEVLRATARADGPKSARSSSGAESLKLLLADLDNSSRLWPVVFGALKEMDEETDAEFVPALKHICRTRIRGVMRDSCFLYHRSEWYILGLPHTLMAYVDLD